MDVRAILEPFDVLRETHGLVDEIRKHATPVSLGRGTRVFREGEFCSGVAFVGAGNVRVFKIGSNGRELTLYHVGPGQTCLLTLNGALTGASYPADGLVEEDVEAVVVPPEIFAGWVEREAAVRRLVFSSMAQRITELMALVDEVAFGRLEQRLGEYLVTAFGSAASPGETLETTHERIAAELGTAREVISRLLKDLERRGAVRLSRGRVTLRDERVLHDLPRRR